MRWINRKNSRLSRQRSSDRTKRTLKVQQLAKRELMAADITLDDGILKIYGTNDNDVIQIEAGNYGGGSARISDDSSNTLEFMYFGDVIRIDVYAYNGNDHVENNTSFPSRL